MGVLTKGRYTYGNKTWTVIQTLTGEKVGDSVFDTTYQIKRIWDGNHFVREHGISMITDGGLIDGAVMVVSPEIDGLGIPRVDFHQRQVDAADAEGIVAIAEIGPGIGEVALLCYHGKVNALVTAAGGAAPNRAKPGDFVTTSSVSAGYGDTIDRSTPPVGAVGTVGLYIDAEQIVSGNRLIIFRPVERG